MKKIAAVVLTVVMLFSVSSSAFAAVSSVQAPYVSSEITADIPDIVSGELEVKSLDELTVEEQKVYETAIESLAGVVPEGMTAKYCNMVSAPESTSFVTLDMNNIKNLETKQLVDDEWVEVKVTEDKDGVYTVSLAGDNSASVSFKLDSETNRPSEQLINGEWVEIEELENDTGIYTVVVSNTYPASVTIKLDNISNARAMQFVDGEWIEVDLIKNPDGTYTATVNGPGFLTILTD